MRISDELIACYAEGTATAEERDLVRKYLCRHPEEYERILCLMDNDTVDYLGERLEVSDDCMFVGEQKFSDIAYSAAAFAPGQSKLYAPKDKLKKNRAHGLYERLGIMSKELDDIL